MNRYLLPALALAGLALSGCPTNVPDVSCTYDLPSPGRVSSTGGFNLLITITGTFDASELPAVHFTSDVDGLLLESGIGCEEGSCFAGARLTDPITPGDHVITAEALTPTGAVACSDTVEVTANTPPTITSITVDPAEPLTSDTLSFTFEATDANGDDVSVSASWADPDGETIAGETVSNINTAVGQTWTLTLTPRDDLDTGEPSSTTVTIGNTAPSAPTVEIGPDPGRDNADLRCWVTDLEDLDPDDQELTVSWSWTVDGGDAGVTTDTVPAASTSAGELWECTAVVGDGTASSDGGAASTTILDVLTAPATIDLGTLPSIDGTGLQRFGEFDRVASIGDIDGDGVGDFVILESAGVNVGGMGQGVGNGRALVFSGASVAASVGPWDADDADYELIGGTGLRLTNAYSPGDINGDGADELVVGFKHISLPNSATGTGVYLVYGNSAVIPALVDMEDDSVVVYGGGEEVGQIPCPVGDLDGDGYAELAIASPIADGISGALYVAYGNPAGFASGLNPDDLQPGFVIEGAQSGQQLGTSCTGTIDLNGDGYNDVVVGAPGAGGSGNGRVLVYQGGEDRWTGSLTSATADVIIDADPSSAGGFGIAMAALGDYDGDGLDDFSIWAQGPDGGQSTAGAVFIASGGDAGFSGAIGSGDLPYVIDGSSEMGFCKTQAGGDVNGDGLGDLLCGDQNPAGIFSGTIGARIFLGSGTPAAELDWDEADVVMTPEGDDDRPGASIAVVQDMNGDDYVEVLVGSPDIDLVLSGNGQPTSAPGVVYLLDLAAE